MLREISTDVVHRHASLAIEDKTFQFTLQFSSVNWAVAYLLLTAVMYLSNGKNNKVLLIAGGVWVLSALIAGFGWF